MPSNISYRVRNGEASQLIVTESTKSDVGHGVRNGDGCQSIINELIRTDVLEGIREVNLFHLYSSHKGSIYRVSCTTFVLDCMNFLSS